MRVRQIFVALSGMLLNVAYAVGVPNVPQNPGEMLSGPNAPQAGRTAVIAYHEGVLFTFPEAPGSPPGDYQVRTWDISDPRNPQVTQVLGTTQHGFMAHGFIKTNDILNSGYTFSVDGQGMAVDAGNLDFPMLGWLHSGMSRPWGVTTYWSYNDTSVPAEIYLNKPYAAEPDASFDHLGLTGVVGHAFVLGRTLYFASDQSRTGIASYDITDPSNPVLLDVLTQGSVGGYWPDPVGINGRLYFFFPSDNPSGGFQVVDATEPTDLRLVADVPLEGNLQYAQFQDEFAFAERYKIDMRTFDVVLELDEDADNRSGDPVDTSQWSLPIGNLVITGGIFKGGTCTVPGFSSTHCGTGMSIWAHQAAPDNRGPFVGYHAPADGETGFPTTHSIHLLIHETLQSPTINSDTVQLRPLQGSGLGQAIAAEYFFASNDILSIVPNQALADNTTYQVDLVEGGILDAVGNGMQGYSFRFSTGSAVAGNARPQIESISPNQNPIVPNDSITLSVTATDPDGDALEYRYDFGDGSAPSNWSASSQTSHQYTETGHFTATVQVRDSPGAVATATIGLTAFSPPAGAAGIASSQLALSDNQLWVVNPDNDSVSIFAANSGNKIREVRSCADPRSVAIDGNGIAWLTCHDADQVLLIDQDGSRVGVLDFAYGSAPMSVVTDPNGDRALVTLYGSGEIALINTASRTEIDRLQLGPTPRSIALTADGSRALVTRFISPSDRGEVWDLNIASEALSLNRTIRLEHQWGTDERFDGRGVPNYLAGIAIAPGGTSAWVTGKKDNVNRGLYLSGEDLDQDNTVRTTLIQIDLDSGTELRELRRDLDNSEQPVGISFSPLGDYVFVALQGNNAVVAVDALKVARGFTGAASTVSRIGVGAAPQGLFFDSAQQRLWVNNFLDRSLEQIELSDFLDIGAASFPAQRHDKTANERLTTSVLSGKRIFYHASDPRMSGEGYISCASCHVDGGHDGQSFDFSGRGEGLRNTTSLRGRAGMGHGLVHWSANFDEIQDFENDIRQAFGGEGFLSDAAFAQTSNPLGAAKAGRNAELDAMADYVASLDLATVPKSPWRSADGALTTPAEGGRDVFTQLNCGDCHQGTQLVASTALAPDLRDVGTTNGGSGGRLGANLAGIDVPTLHGIWNTAPYLHNGTASGLEALFVATGGLTLQAETADLGGNHEVRDRDHWSLAEQAVVREGEFVQMDDGAAASFAFDGESGPATLRLRYHANYNDPQLTLTVNGNTQSISLPLTLNGDWRYRQWGSYDIPISLLAGSNTITLRKDSGASFALDEIEIGDTDSTVLAADAHLTAANLDQATRDQLIAYLLQLDGRPANGLEISIAQPAADQTVTSQFIISGEADGGDQVWVAIDDGPYEQANGGDSWSLSVNASMDDNLPHILTARVVDSSTGTWREVQRQVRISGSTPTTDPMIFTDGFE